MPGQVVTGKQMKVHSVICLKPQKDINDSLI